MRPNEQDGREYFFVSNPDFDRMVAEGAFLEHARVFDNQYGTTLRAELQRMADTPIDELETTLLVHPAVLQDFLDYNDFLAEADALLVEMGLDGTLQIASFHPRYQFAGTRADDITNATNRSPHPTLHLLREASIERAVAAFPEAESIYQANQRRLRELGPAGWALLRAHWQP